MGIDKRGSRFGSPSALTRSLAPCHALRRRLGACDADLARAAPIVRETSVM